MLARALDVGIDAIDEGLNDGRTVGVIPIELLRDIAPIAEQAIADIALELAPPEDLRDGAGGLPSPDLELEQSIRSDVVALREEQVVLAVRIDVGDAEPVSQDLDRLLESAEGQPLCALGCRGRGRARAGLRRARGGPLHAGTQPRERERRADRYSPPGGHGSAPGLAKFEQEAIALALERKHLGGVVVLRVMQYPTLSGQHEAGTAGFLLDQRRIDPMQRVDVTGARARLGHM